MRSSQHEAPWKETKAKMLLRNRNISFMHICNRCSICMKIECQQFQMIWYRVKRLRFKTVQNSWGSAGGHVNMRSQALTKIHPWGTRSGPCCPRRLLLLQWLCWRRAWLCSCCSGSRASCELDHGSSPAKKKLERSLNNECCWAMTSENKQRLRLDFFQSRLWRSAAPYTLESAELGDWPFPEKTTVTFKTFFFGVLYVLLVM